MNPYKIKYRYAILTLNQSQELSNIQVRSKLQNKSVNKNKWESRQHFVYKTTEFAWRMFYEDFRVWKSKRIFHNSIRMLRK